MKPRLIVIDGKTYNSVNEMPEDVRRQYEQAMSSFKDQDSNRVPDVLESNNLFADNNRNGIPDSLENGPGAPIIANAVKVVVDGKEFNSLDDLPPEARRKYEQAMGALDANRNGIPDFMEGMMNIQPGAAPASSSHSVEAPRPARTPIVPTNDTFTPDTSNGWMLVLLGALFFFICAAAAAGIWYFFLR